jgi:hypothetical protein
MNKHIELVKKWLADKDSVSQQKLEDNASDAHAAYYAAEADANAYRPSVANDAYYAAYRAASSAAYYAYAADVAYVAYWVKRYEESTK